MGKKRSIMLSLFIMINCFCGAAQAKPQKTSKQTKWKITAYCHCQKCCGKKPHERGYMVSASGKKIQRGMIACNWLPFGTKVHIEGLGIFTVADRGAKSLFGCKRNKIKHIDVYIPDHTIAKVFGEKWMNVKVL